MERNFKADVPNQKWAGNISYVRTKEGWLYLSKRVDNGAECVSGRLRTRAEKAGVTILCIQPGKLQQNAYVERYNRTVRTEWLGRYHFDSIEEVQELATAWLWACNNERPNMDIGGVSPT